MTRAPQVGRLQKCPECGQHLPSDWDWDVRALVWLHDQPRRISPTNNDLTIHDGANRRNRFLNLEFKRDGRVIAEGQMRALVGKSLLPGNGVLLVRGTRVDDIAVQRVFEGRLGKPIETTCESLNTAIAAWLRGNTWTDSEVVLAERAARLNVPAGRPGHTHGFSAVVDGVSRCVQDYYAEGLAPETGCGAELEIPAA